MLCGFTPAASFAARQTQIIAQNLTTPACRGFGVQIAANGTPVPAARRYVWFPSADILDVETASPRSLGLHLVDAHFSVFRFVMRDSEIVAIEFRNQDARLGAKTSGILASKAYMVGILLFENIAN